MKKLALLFIVFCIFVLPDAVFARENVDYWYIKKFDSTINVNKDASLDITEKITADCGSAQKHGIFRVLPLTRKLDNQTTISNPIALSSITDFNDKSIPYTTSVDRYNKTITWKIGDPNKTVTGVNYYKIVYHVENAVLGLSDASDELYWNLNGNFWDIPIDSFSATINLPQGVDQNNSEINIYSGAVGKKNALNPSSSFTNDNRLVISYGKTMNPGEGITLSEVFPKGVVTLYQPGFWEKYGAYFYLTIPLVVLAMCYLLWSKYGRDPKINPTIAPEFEPPEKLAPLELGVAYKDGGFNNNYISASVINLAVNGKLRIKTIGKKGIFSKEDHEFDKTSSGYKMSGGETTLYNALFGDGPSVKLSSLKNSFYINIPEIKRAAVNFLVSMGWVYKNSFLAQILFFVAAAGFIFLAVASFTVLGPVMALALAVSAVIVFIFAFLMRRRPLEGAKLYRRIEGFKLYMTTAEKYRQKFNEKENIFERFLPYAILFGITSEWIKKMREIYGEKYFNNYVPIWYVGSGFGSFNVDSIASEINNISSNMAATMSSMPSSSGSGGSGFSGGGGGGGGGGGW